MNSRNAISTRVTATLALLAATTMPAHAYIDPGTGSMLIQLAAASIAGAIFFLRDLPFRISAWFNRNRARDKDAAGSAEPGE